MKDFSLTKEIRGDFDILRLEGSLDMYSFPKLEAALNQILADHRSYILLNMKDLTYIGSAGLGALISFQKEAARQQGDLKLIAPPSQVKKIIDLLGFSRLLKTYEDEAAAFDAFVDEFKGLITTTIEPK